MSKESGASLLCRARSRYLVEVLPIEGRQQLGALITPLSLDFLQLLLPRAHTVGTPTPSQIPATHNAHTTETTHTLTVSSSSLRQ